MGKKKKRALRLSLSNRVLLTFLVITAAGLMAAMLVSMRYIVNLSLEQMDQTLLSTARSLAGNSQVISVLETKTVSQELNDYLDHMVEVTPDLLIITVADTDSIRYYHVNKDLLGQEVVGEDRFRVLETGEAYLGPLLVAEGLVEDEQGPYGLYFHTADGETADEGAQEWWKITKGGEMVNTSADTTPIAHGDHFELTFMVGYDEF